MFVKQTGYIYSNKYRAEGKGKKRLNVRLLGMATGSGVGWGKAEKDRQTIIQLASAKE